MTSASHRRNSTPRFRPGGAVVLAAALLTLATGARATPVEDSFGDVINRFPLAAPGPHGSEMLAKATVAMEALRTMDLPRAHLAINEALQLDARHSYLHFLNGFVYHLQARQGDTQKTEVAIEGYQQALRLDPGNWIAQEFLGLAYMDQKRFDQARLQFSEVLLMTPESLVSQQGLMVASYLTGDAGTACAMADQLDRADQASPQQNVAVIRSSIAVYASCGRFDEADRMRMRLAERGGTGPEADRVDRRLARWKAFYQQHEQGAVRMKTRMHDDTAELPRDRLAQAFTLPNLNTPLNTPAAAAESPAQATAPSPAPAEPPARPAAPAQAEPRSDVPRMVLIDVVLLSTQELISTAKGVNLLNALTLQLGSASGNLAAYSRVISSTSNNGAAADVSTAITRAVTIPALSYSLNIANANNSVNEVLARPTLAAIEGLPSEFFSGTNLSAGVVSTSTQGGTTVVPLDKRFGIKLAVTPRFLPQGQVQLKVDAQRTSLNASADNPKVAYQIEIAEVVANANVVMNLGDTLVLSGLSEKSTSTIRDGVPGLQDVPVVQYLFSNKKTNDIQRSVLILVTPRSPIQVAESARGSGDTTAAVMKALREKFGLADSVPSNVEAIMNQLKPADLFREFRQGDVSMERWDRMRSTRDRLEEALGFLYY